MRPSRVIILISAAVFAASLTQKGFHTAGEDPGDWSPGFYLLLVGPLGLLAGIYEWFANPLLLAAWTFSWFGKNKVALPLALGATALIVAFQFRETIIASEAPTYANITGYAAGYWLWLSSAIIATIGTAIGLLNKPLRQAT